MFGDRCKAQTFDSLARFHDHIMISDSHKKRLNDFVDRFQAEIYIALEVNAYLLGHKRDRELEKVPAGAVLPVIKPVEVQPSSKVAKAPKKKRVPLAAKYGASHLARARADVHTENAELYMAVYHHNEYAGGK